MDSASADRVVRSRTKARLHPPRHRDRATEFLRVAHRFRLGNLPTEQPHPATARLSRWARLDLSRAVAVLKEVDLDALRSLEARATELDRLTESVWATLDAGRRVFLCGCGATGRLALTLELLWRQAHGDSEQVVSLMAGGDVAMVHALEGFEDHSEFGARHLTETGFANGDLLIACTEGGETPYVIGAVETAAKLSSNAPYFLYCNPDSALTREVARFRRVYDNPSIHKVCLDVGPMALSGSTRMQASTVLQLAVGLALLHPGSPAHETLARYRAEVAALDFSFLAGFIETESGIYSAGDHVIYRVRDYGITVFTDTTERAPTFSLVPFDQLKEPRARHSLCYVVLDEADSAERAWSILLNRAPRPLDWSDTDSRTSLEYLRDFDFSVDALELRRKLIPGRTQYEFRIQASPGGIEFGLAGQEYTMPVCGLCELFRHLLLKQALNIHSTLVMGRMGRYENNLMTWVSPTNGKLIDRAARYVSQLLACDGRNGYRYEEIVRQLFTEMDGAGPGESIVLKTYRALL